MSYESSNILSTYGKCSIIQVYAEDRGPDRYLLRNCTLFLFILVFEEYSKVR